MLIIFLIGIIILFLLRKKTLKKDLFISLILALLISFFIICGFNLTNYDTTLLNNNKTYLKIISLIPLITVIVVSLWYFLDNLKLKKDCFLDKYLFTNHGLIKLTLLIFVLWIPVFLAFYPGNFSYDSSVQLNQVVGNTYTTHHPILHTLLVGFNVFLGDLFLGNAIKGVAIYSLIQMLILAFSLANILAYLHNHQAPRIIKYLALTIFAFLPIHSIMAITVTKDVLFTAFFNIAFIELLKLLENKENYLKKKKNIFILIISLLLTCLFRNNGIYAFIFFLPFILVYLRKYLKKLILITLTILFSYFLINNALNTVLNPEKAAIREMLSIPIQQLGRVINYANDIEENDEETIQYFFSDPLLESYSPHKADNIKFKMYNDRLNQSFFTFIKLWVKLGLKYPVIYIDAFMENIIGYWNIFDKLPDETTYRTLIEIRCVDDFQNYDIHFTSKFPKLYNYFYNLIENCEYNFLVQIILQPALYIWLFVFSIFYCIHKKDYEFIVLQMFLMGLLLTVLLGPVAILRYVYPFYTLMPIIIYKLYR